MTIRWTDSPPFLAPSGSERPGDFPYTRGISAEPRPWIMGQYAGFGTPAQTNARFRALLDAGVTGFSVALDLPTQMGFDSDDPSAAGEVGRVGVAIDSLADIEALMAGIPLAEITQVRTTANAIGFVWAAFFIALARKQGVDPNSFGLFIQNDVLKEFIARGTQIFPPEPSLALAVDVIEYVGKHLPRWTPLAMSGYHIREAGSDAVQEVAFTFANAIAYLDAAVNRGIPVDAVAPTFYTFLSATMDFLTEVAKFRAARRVWAKLLRERYGATDPRSVQLRIFVFTAGSSLTAQQPLTNVARTAIEALAAALGGVQTMHVCAYDEAVGVPTEAAATLALRTQQVVAFETGLTSTVDPLAGSYVVESLTDSLEHKITASMQEIEDHGGPLACISSGWYARRLSDAAYEQTRAVESGERVVVGVNRYVVPPEPIEVFEIDSSVEAEQAAATKAVRERRDPATVATTLKALGNAAAAGENVIEPCVAAVSAYATVGEIVSVLRKIHGSWSPAADF